MVSEQFHAHKKGSQQQILLIVWYIHQKKRKKIIRFYNSILKKHQNGSKFCPIQFLGSGVGNWLWLEKKVIS